MKPRPAHVVALPFSTIYGDTPSERESWGLIDPHGDLLSYVECADKDVALYLAEIWNEDHRQLGNVRSIMARWKQFVPCICYPDENDQIRISPNCPLHDPLNVAHLTVPT